MTDISVWGYQVPKAWLTKAEADYLMGLPRSLPTVEWVWSEMDRIWKQMGLDNSHPLVNQPIVDFYQHPVWLMNGVFTALDPVSASHRDAIARYLGKAGAKLVADYGGGFGELALAITREIPDATTYIVEPYPSRVGIERLKDEPRIRFVTDMSLVVSDAIVVQDVLEHVDDPIFLASEIASAVREGGYVIFANCFYPVIQCHLPASFHLRHTFPAVMKELGLHYLGVVGSAEHVHVFQRCGPVDLSRARRAERISRLSGPILNRVQAALSRVKRLLVR